MDENRRLSAYFTWRYRNKKSELANDDKFVRGPHRIGNSILIYGRKNTSFPFQAFVRCIINHPSYERHYCDDCLIMGFLFLDSVQLLGWSWLALYVCYLFFVDSAYWTIYQQYCNSMGAGCCIWGGISSFYNRCVSSICFVPRFQSLFVCLFSSGTLFMFCYCLPYLFVSSDFTLSLRVVILE